MVKKNLMFGMEVPPRVLRPAGVDVRFSALCLPLLISVLFFSCSFDYGNKGEAGKDQPDIIMENVEYVRVRDGDPMVRFQAELAERFEESQTMNLKRFTFEQFEKSGQEIDARGSAGEATVELESGNIRLEGGVTLSVDSEDITIQTNNLRWQDREKRLSGSPAGTVDIERSDGTGFSGRGFSADARSRTWGFDAGVTGLYIDEDEDGENDVISPEDYEAAAEAALPETDAADGPSPQRQQEALEK